MRIEENIDLIRGMPKIELHVHLEGSLTPKLLMRLAQRNGISLPFNSEESFQPLYQFKNFSEFARSLLFGVALLRTPQDFYDAVINLGEMLHHENIVYAEVTWTPQFYLSRPCGLTQALAAMNEARTLIEQTLGIRISWLPDLVRSRPEAAMAAARWLTSIEPRDHGIVALGLGGPEPGWPASNFAEIFSIFRKLGLPANPHAGETEAAWAVEDAMRTLHASRIGHGVRAIEDEAVLARVVQSGVSLEICLTSNVRLGLFPDYASHPIRRLINAGCLVSLNTDDPVLFQTNLTREYLIAMEYHGLTIDDLRTLNSQAVQACHAELDVKSLIKARIQETT